MQQPVRPNSTYQNERSEHGRQSASPRIRARRSVGSSAKDFTVVRCASSIKFKTTAQHQPPRPIREVAQVSARHLSLSNMRDGHIGCRSEHPGEDRLPSWLAIVLDREGVEGRRIRLGDTGFVRHTVNRTAAAAARSRAMSSGCSESAAILRCRHHRLRCLREIRREQELIG
jgi:hypothetical protein